MSKQSEYIGESGKTSVRINHQAGQSQWSFGWGQDQSSNTNNQKNNAKYHNESKIVFQDKTKEAEEEEKRKAQEKKRKEEQINSKLPTYDPKNGGKSSLNFGNEPTDYRKKDQVFTSVKVKNPPGGKSSIQFG